MKNKNNKKGGYTIIETMIAISVFLVVIMIGMSSLLNANLIHQKSQDMRSIMDNLSFIMEDISRNLRTGYDYSGGGTEISFESAKGDPLDSSDQWIYKIESNNIIKSVDNGSNWTPPLNPEGEIEIDGFYSGFTVTGEEPPNPDGTGDSQQPFVTIRLIGTINYKNIDTPFSLQTSVSQRLVDIVN